MTENNTEKIHALSEPKNGAKMIPPPSPSSSQDIYSSKKHSMNYVTVDGVKLRTGYDDIRDWYFLCLKELLDNAVDFLWEKYKGASDAAINVYIEKTSDSLLRIKIRNTNPDDKDALTLENLNHIFDFDMTYGSKQNLHIISRGVLGDAMKQVLALPYVLIHMHDDGTTFANRQWDRPLIIRSNGKEFHVPLYVDLANQLILTKPIEEKKIDVKTRTKFAKTTDTEIEVILPIIDEVRNRKSFDIHEIAQYCREYPIFTTDISFKFKLVDNSPDNPNKTTNTVVEEEEVDKRDFESDLAKAIAGPAPKAAIKLDFPALHPIAEKWKNKASVHSYKPGEFTTFLESVHDKANVTVYQRIKQLRECTNMPMTPDTAISIEELVANNKNKHKKEEELYYKLRGLMPAPEKLNLPYVTGEPRKAALVKRISQLYEGKLRTKEAFYTAVNGFYKDDIVAYPFVFEIVAIPYTDEAIENNEDSGTVFKGSVNYSVSPRGNMFEGNYSWDDPKKSSEFSRPRGFNVPAILGVYNFRFYRHADSKIKLPCVIFANLVTPTPVYHGADKSGIDTTPFAEAIIKACRKVADNIQTFKAAGWEFHTKSNRSFTPVREKKVRVDDVIEELLRKWI